MSCCTLCPTHKLPFKICTMQSLLVKWLCLKKQGIVVAIYEARTLRSVSPIKYSPTLLVVYHR